MENGNRRTLNCRQARSAASLQRVAAAAHTDGCEGAALFASLGTSGAYPGNSARDMIRALKPDSIQTYDIETLGMCRDGAARQVKASVILPHEMWRQLSNAGALHAVMGHPSLWHSFWQAVQNEEWFTNHPMRHFCLEYGHKACPVVIHGDGAPIGKQHHA